MNQSGQVPLHGVTMESMDPRVTPEDDSFPELSCPDLIGASSLIFVIPGLTGNPGVHA